MTCVRYSHSILKALTERLYVWRRLELLWIQRSATSYTDLDLDDVIRYCSLPKALNKADRRLDGSHAIGIAIPGYRVQGVIGKGGQGTVYLCQEVESQSVCAIKVCNRPDEREYQNLKSLQQLQHPNIVRLFDCILEPFAIVMEYVHGQSLKEVMQTSEDGEGRKLDLELIKLIGSQMLDALSALHRMAITHRDLKPSNILCTFSHNQTIEKVTLIDFGASRHDNFDVTMTNTGQFVGTWQYFSPEQCRGDAQLDARVDVWSAGVVIYEMAAGKNPFFSLNVLELFNAVRRKRFVVIVTCDVAMNLFLKTALKKDPQDR
ncbi:hypothetical protein GUITHDRAFT_64621, partial [Guillardia theta CCMP2712]